jgi:protein involved in polysaccharide export with SLBB domain
MTVQDLIQVGGGLKASADTETADLTKYKWGEKGQLTGEHQSIQLSAALAGESSANLPLNNGDVLTIRQLPGWNDLGASIAVKGEVKHPGTYGIRPGERLSSVLQRAGGFQEGAYVRGAILERAQVRELQTKEQTQLMLRVKDLQNNVELLPEGDANQKRAKENALRQYQNALTQLGTNTPVGRVTMRISPEVSRWKNTSADLEVRAGDVLVVPKQPSFVMVTGQVFNPTAVSYRPGKSAKWYLSQSGGPTAVANKKAIFVIRADGSVIGAKESLWSGASLNAVLQPGDTVVVPEKAIGGGVQWQTVFLAAQVASSVVSTLFIALHY